MQSITYPVGDSLYLNITNRCTNECDFCIRGKARKFNQKYELWLTSEPTPEEVIKAVGDPKKYKEIVFCGYGEPLIRLGAIKEISRKLKNGHTGILAHGQTKIRIDTNGQANLFFGKNILPQLKGLVDKMSISLNAENNKVYETICHSFFGLKAFDAVIAFAKEAKKHIPEVEITVVDLPDIIDIEKARLIAKDLGLSFRVRPYYEETYIK